MLIDIDEGALARAATVLGTTTMVDTVNRALQLIAQIADQQAARDRFDDLIDLVGDRMVETDVRAQAWP
jgi:Arc/MetJ family transcription regulator